MMSLLLKLQPYRSLFAVALFASLLGGALSQFQCSRSGRQCSGCHLVEECAERSGHLAIEQSSPVERCVGSEVCDASAEEPRCESGATCRYKPFSCPADSDGEEIFPDPYSCVEYHVCNDGHAAHLSCGVGQVFDPKARRCVAEGAGCPTWPVPPCREIGDTWSIPGTDYEFVCVEELGDYRVLFPRVSPKKRRVRLLADEPSSSSDAPSSSSVATSGATGATSEGSTASGSTSEGTPAAGSTSEGSTVSGSTSEGTPATGSTSEGTTATGSTSEGTAATGSTSEGTAATGSTTSETGSSEITTTETPGTTTPMPSPCTSGAGAYPVTGDCRKYYLCYLQPDGTIGYREMRCRDGSHFDGGARRCVAGACTDFPSTASTESTSPTPTPISCTSDGAVADEGCCKCYYMCYNVGGSLNYVHRCCRQGSHFDGSMRRCVAGDKCTPTTTCATNRDEI